MIRKSTLHLSQFLMGFCILSGVQIIALPQPVIAETASSLVIADPKPAECSVSYDVNHKPTGCGNKDGGSSCGKGGKSSCVKSDGATCCVYNKDKKEWGCGAGFECGCQAPSADGKTASLSCNGYDSNCGSPLMARATATAGGDAEPACVQSGFDSKGNPTCKLKEGKSCGNDNLECQRIAGTACCYTDKDGVSHCGDGSDSVTCGCAKKGGGGGGGGIGELTVKNARVIGRKLIQAEEAESSAYAPTANELENARPGK